MPKENIYNDLYESAKNGKTFTNLMPLVLSRENILLAYRNIKNNAGSNTAGTDKLTIADIGKLTPEEVTAKVRYIVSGTKRGYRPKPIRRKDIPKPNGETRPLGIPCIFDRLIQQCFKQVLEPICEAQFSKHSYGFRPNCSVENAIADTYRLLQRSHLHYVIEFDIKSFFDNVNHVKLMRQMWTLGVRDKHFLGKILRMLKAPIKMPNGELIYPTKGTPQGGVISPLLANIVLNELDHRVDVKRRYSEFLGFKIKMQTKGKKKVVKSHISDKQFKRKKKALIEQIKRIAHPQTNKDMHGEIHKYNLMVMGMQNYYRIATNINLDCGKISRVIITVISNRLKGISRKGRKLTPAETIRYGKTKMLRYLMGEPIYPIGYVQHKNPLCKRIVKSYEVEGTKIELLSQQLYDKSIEYADNRISLYRAQKGRCAVTGEKFTSTEEIHCHHKIPKSQGGTDDYQNLILVTVIVHKLIHAIHDETIKRYLRACKPNLKKLNVLRKLVGNTTLSVGRLIRLREMLKMERRVR